MEPRWSAFVEFSTDASFYIGHDEMASTFRIEICYIRIFIVYIYRKRAWNDVWFFPLFPFFKLRNQLFIDVKTCPYIFTSRLVLVFERCQFHCLSYLRYYSSDSLICFGHLRVTCDWITVFLNNFNKSNLVGLSKNISF